MPLVFSIALFALPLSRAVWQPFKARRAARENSGRKAMLRAVLEKVGRKQGVSEEELIGAWATAAGSPTEPEDNISRGRGARRRNVDLEDAAKGVRYRFPDLEAEAKAVEAEREAAAEDEARMAPVVFSSEN